MIAVIDANYIIHRRVQIEQISKGYITSSVEKELKDKSSIVYFQFINFSINIRNPRVEYINRVKSEIKDKHFGISETDIEVVALTLEISDELSNSWIDSDNINSIQSLICLSDDNGVKSALSLFGVSSNSVYQSKIFKLRCYACFTIYDQHLDYCKNCGYSTLTRVSVSEDNGKTKVYLKSNYNPKEKVIKGNDGIIFKCADQKEYVRHCEILKRQAKKTDDDLIGIFFKQ